MFLGSTRCCAHTRDASSNPRQRRLASTSDLTKSFRSSGTSICVWIMLSRELIIDRRRTSHWARLPPVPFESGTIHWTRGHFNAHSDHPAEHYAPVFQHDSSGRRNHCGGNLH